ncbi:MAG TPA: ester cyclase, partial [Anaerolineales bacterium]|nr:ester cyclase [Anaerolineales bacterium]
ADFVDHSLPPDVPPNREGLKSLIASMRGAFPDLEYSIDDQIAEGDRLSQRLTGRGTMKGAFLGMAPTGRTAAWQEFHFHRFDANGLLAEHWDLTDSLSMLVQLGLGNAAVGP